MGTLKKGTHLFYISNSSDDIKSCFFSVKLNMTLFSPLFKGDKVMYKVTMALTLVPAIFDLIAHLPAPIAGTQFYKAVSQFRLQYLPLANIGLSWVVPTILGLVISIFIHVWHRKTNKI